MTQLPPSSAEQLRAAMQVLSDWLASVRGHVMWEDGRLRDARRRRRERWIHVAMLGAALVLAFVAVYATTHGPLAPHR